MIIITITKWNKLQPKNNEGDSLASPCNEGDFLASPHNEGDSLTSPRTPTIGDVSPSRRLLAVSETSPRLGDVSPSPAAVALWVAPPETPRRRPPVPGTSPSPRRLSFEGGTRPRVTLLKDTIIIVKNEEQHTGSCPQKKAQNLSRERASQRSSCTQQ